MKSASRSLQTVSLALKRLLREVRPGLPRTNAHGHCRSGRLYECARHQAAVLNFCSVHLLAS